MSIPLTETAYLGLRDEILAFRLEPGERLKINNLATRFNVSSGAIREALARLHSEGLVVAEAWKGFRVAAVSAEDLDDLTRSRLTIETICLRRAIETGGLEWETRLVAAGHRLSRISQLVGSDGVFASDAWAEVHAEYHLRLVDACDSPWLLHMRGILFAHSERYRRMALTPRSGRDLDAEHRAIARAALDRDIDRATKLLADHLLLTPFMVRKYAEHSGIFPRKDSVQKSSSRDGG